MDLFDVAKACFRRFYVVIPIVLVAAWFAHDKYSAVQPVYTSNAVFAFAQPSSQIPVVMPGEQIQRNGLIDAGGANLLANMVTLGLRDPNIVNQVVAAGGQPNYQVQIYPTAANTPALPMVLIQTTENDAVSGPKTVDLVLAQADNVLRSNQELAGVPEEQFAKTIVVSPTSPPVAAMPSRARAALAILLAGIGMAIVAGVIVDVLVLGWKLRRSRRRTETPPAPESTTPPASKRRQPPPPPPRLPPSPPPAEPSRHHRVPALDAVRERT